MFLKKPKASTDPELRSLLQKSVRRGDSDLAAKVMERLFAVGDDRWVRSRVVVLTYEECWPEGANIHFDASKQSKIDWIANLARKQKAKNAAGLGTLAYALSEGDDRALMFAPDRKAVRILTSALARPLEYFAWLEGLAGTDDHKRSVEYAKRYVSATTWPWDRAFVLAAAYLLCNSPVATNSAAIPSPQSFPFWVAIDKHTPAGKEALKRVAARHKVNLRHATWASFYFESATVNDLQPSPWWEGELEWRFDRLGTNPTAAAALWKLIRDDFAEEVSEAARSLQNRVLNPFVIVNDSPGASRTLL